MNSSLTASSRSRGHFEACFRLDNLTGAHQVVLIPIVRGMAELENIFIDDYQ
jgi:hypothetical protein